MIPFISKFKKKSKTSIMQLILDQFQRLEMRQEEQENLQREDIQKLLARQRKSETIMDNILEILDEYRIALEAQNSMRNKEKVLVGYINSYDESMQQVERMLSEAEGEDSVWVKQLQLMREQLCDSMKGAELRIIKDCDISVDFTLHEVIGISDTKLREKNNRVCKVVTPGVSYQGEVLNKAKIIAYQYKEDTIG
ncbi:MAG: hypothetical protein K0R34_3189 [Herbinix sp.]|jgi:molecular chaperone GrpE (heat shock protein)|nr:hypothetical protein [Herbinix sp.]